LNGGHGVHAHGFAVAGEIAKILHKIPFLLVAASGAGHCGALVILVTGFHSRRHIIYRRMARRVNRFFAQILMAVAVFALRELRRPAQRRGDGNFHALEDWPPLRSPSTSLGRDAAARHPPPKSLRRMNIIDLLIAFYEKKSEWIVLNQADGGNQG